MQGGMQYVKRTLTCHCLISFTSELSHELCSPYPPLNLRQPSISSRHCMYLEQSSAALHICSITSHLLLSSEDILLQTLLSVITVVVPAK